MSFFKKIKISKKEDRLKLKIQKIHDKEKEDKKRLKEKTLQKTIPDEPSIADVVQEQREKPMTSTLCPESIKKDQLPEVRRMPEEYLEINIIKKSRVVDAFYLPVDKKIFHYKKKQYNVKEDAIYLLPTKTGMFMPSCYYRESNPEPTGFKQMNKGITGKALSLLYMEQLYTSLLYSEDVKYNFFIVILSIIMLIAYGIGCYFVFFHDGGLIFPPPETPLPPISIILGGIL